jgi:magnesium-transporting ATPase (P-type)
MTPASHEMNGNYSISRNILTILLSFKITLFKMTGSKQIATTAPAYHRQPYLLSIEEVVNQLGSNVDAGLSASDAQRHLEECGENKLDGDGGVSWYRVLLKQVSNAMILASEPTQSRSTLITLTNFDCKIGPHIGNGSLFWSPRLA